MLTFTCSPSRLNRNLIGAVISSALAAIGLVYGVIPQLSWDIIPLKFNITAYSQQNFSDTQVQNYARAIWQIEQNRQRAFSQIRQIIGRNPSNLACHEPKSLRNLPRKAQKIAVDFCNNSKKIAQNSGLSTIDFNRITQQAKNDRNLTQRINNAILQIRRKSQ